MYQAYYGVRFYTVEHPTASHKTACRKTMAIPVFRSISNKQPIKKDLDVHAEYELLYIILKAAAMTSSLENVYADIKMLSLLIVDRVVQQPRNLHS